MAISVETLLARVVTAPSLALRHHVVVRRWWCALTVIVLALAGALAIIALRGAAVA